LEETLAGSSPGDVGAVRLDEQGRLVIPPLSAEDVPAEAKALRDELSGMLPFVPIASLLIELDARTNFLACFTHAGGRKSTQSVDLKRNILAVLIAGATNLGLARMSEACGVSVDVLAWTQEWYVREETLREANTILVNHHYGLELAKAFGGGTMSSSDGQRFPVRGKSLTARDMNIHGGRVLSMYTHCRIQFCHCFEGLLMRCDDLYVAGLARHLPAVLEVADAVADGRYDAGEQAANDYVSVTFADGAAPPQMAVRAGGLALSRSGVPAGEVTLLLHASAWFQGVDYWPAASYVHREVLGANRRAPALDVAQMCCGTWPPTGS
jgi:hypothetical protein